MVDHAPHYPSFVPDFEPYQERQLRHPATRYPVGQSVQTNDPEQSLPLFLSDRDGEAEPSKRMPPLRQRRAAYVTSGILAGVSGCAAMAILAALVSPDSVRETIASAKVSTMAVISAASAAMQPNSTQPSTQPTAPDIQPKEAAQRSEIQAPDPRSVAVAVVAPTREDIKTAYQSALQSGSAPQTAAVPEPAISEHAIHHLDPGEIASLLKRADALIATGDVAAARLVLRRAAEAGDGRAAMRLAETYDPTVLEKLGVHGVVPDLVMARSWYEKASRLGAPEAASQLELLANRQR